MSRETVNNGRVLSPAMLASFGRDFAAVPARRALMNAATHSGLTAAAYNRVAVARGRFTFSLELETGKVTDQKKSGRCWLFAGLNTLRHEFEKRHRVEFFELSQSYLMFWDKLEKANYALEAYIATAADDIRDRTVMWLLDHPLEDGGQWDMFADLVRKYGIVPKGDMPESFASSDSRDMNRVLTSKVRADAARLRAARAKGANEDTLRVLKAEMLNEIYRMLAVIMGEPPRTLDLEFRDKDKNYVRDAGFTPLDFYAKYFGRAMDDYVSVINAPTVDKPFGRTYTVEYLGNVVGGRGVLYLNVDFPVFRALTLAQLQDGEPAWFGVDMGAMIDRDTGFMDEGLYDYGAALDAPLAMTKAERLDYGESRLTHAMVLTGVNVVDGIPQRWKVENSWGDKAGNQGFFVMSDGWFEQYAYQVVIHKKHLSPEFLRALEEPPVVLPPWDPMGSLAG